MWKKIISFALGLSMVIAGVAGIIHGFKTTDESGSDSPIETVADNLDNAEKSPLEVAAKSAILIDGVTGKVLLEQDSHKELSPASVTKVMTMLLVMEAIDDGKISLDDQVSISSHAASMGGSQMYMEAGEKHTVEELLKGVAMASANDACVALAEYVAGSEDIFVEKMNNRAKELGMVDTHFVNTNGLPVADHYSSAYDIAVMSKKLYEFSQVRQWFTTWQSTITIGLPGKEKEFGLTNTNKLIRSYDGCDGIKTGYTSDAGYCLSASATRGDTHLIAVVLGCETSAGRNAQVSKIFDYGFANYESKVLVREGQVMCQVSFANGEPQVVDAISGEDIFILIEKGADTGDVITRVYESVELPLEKRTEIGKIIVKQGGETMEYPLLAGSNVGKASFRSLLMRRIGSFREDVK